MSLLFFPVATIIILTTIFLCTVESGHFNLTILHNNDFHVHYLPMRELDYVECSISEAKNSTDCIAGIARNVALVKSLRKRINNTLFLNAGDHFAGSYWYTLLRSSLVAQMVGLLRHDAMAIGNHEFDDGPEELENFIKQVQRVDSNLGIISANIQVAGDSVLAGLIGRSIVKVLAGNLKVAIIGYTTPDTMFLAKPGNKVVIGDEVQAIKREIAQLKALHPTLNIFIAVGHSGYERDLQIATAISDLDVIVGGHTDTFLFSGGPPPSTEVPEGEYPTVVQHQQTGDQTLVVQAFAYGKYLGKLDLVFDDRGRVTQYSGQPILVSNSIKEDGDTKRLLLDLNDQLNDNLLRRIGFTQVDLVQKRCRVEQCNIGNLIADALAAYSAEGLRFMKQKTDFPSCSDQPPLAIINSGTIRGGIRSGVINYKNVLSALPIGNKQGLMHIKGSDLLALFEASARQHRQGGFLQVSSAFEVHYKRSTGKNSSKLSLERVRIWCNDSHTRWTAVDKQSTYHVVVSEFTVRGGDGYSMLKSVNWTHYHISDSDVLAKYIRQVDNATTVLDGRLLIH